MECFSKRFCYLCDIVVLWFDKCTQVCATCSAREHICKCAYRCLCVGISCRIPFIFLPSVITGTFVACEIHGGIV